MRVPPYQPVLLPARIFASSRRLTLLTVGAALALTTACGANTAEVPRTVPSAQETTSTTASAEETQQPIGEVQELDDEGSVFYETCEAAAAEGVFNILGGTAGYRIELDEDGNGVACEG